MVIWMSAMDAHQALTSFSLMLPLEDCLCQINKPDAVLFYISPEEKHFD